MPLLDHFRPPWDVRSWESFAMTWAVGIANDLNQHWLSDDALAEVRCHPTSRVGFKGLISPLAPNSSIPVLPNFPGPPKVTLTTAFPDAFEVTVYQTEGGMKLVGVVSLVTPSMKASERQKRAFAAKCAGYLAQGIGLVVVDVVTTRQANLHAAILELLGQTTTGLPTGTELYAAAYRPIVRDAAELIEVWPEPLAVDRVLPTLPLTLSAELCVPIDLEATYTAVRERRRLT